MVEVITWGCKNMKTLHSSIDLDVFPCQTVPHSGLRNSPYPHRIVSVSSSYRWLHWQFGRDRILIGPSVPHIPPKHESPSATRICKFYIYIQSYCQMIKGDQPHPPNSRTRQQWWVRHMWSIKPWYTKVEFALPKLWGPKIVCFPMLSLLISSILCFSPLFCPENLPNLLWQATYQSKCSNQKLRVFISLHYPRAPFFRKGYRIPAQKWKKKIAPEVHNGWKLGPKDPASGPNTPSKKLTWEWEKFTI